MEPAVAELLETQEDAGHAALYRPAGAVLLCGLWIDVQVFTPLQYIG